MAASVLVGKLKSICMRLEINQVDSERFLKGHFKEIRIFLSWVWAVLDAKIVTDAAEN